MSAENLALLLSGEALPARTDDPAAQKVVVGPVAEGRWYALGAAPDNPIGVLDAAVEAVKFGATKADAAGTDAAAADWDYDARGLLYIERNPAGNPNGLAGKFVEVTFTTQGRSHAGAKATAALDDKFGEVRYYEHSADSGGQNIVIPKCSIGASGDSNIKADGRSESQKVTLTFGIETPPGGLGAIYVDGAVL